MYLHLGQEVLIKTDDLIGIFDMEKTTISKKTKEFLVEASKKDEVITVSYEMPKSFILTAQKKDKKKVKVYISQISTATLKKRQHPG